MQIRPSVQQVKPGSASGSVSYQWFLTLGFVTSSGRESGVPGYVSVAAQAPSAKETSAETATSRVNDVFCLGRSTSSSTSGIVLYEAMFLTAPRCVLDGRGKMRGTVFFSPEVTAQTEIGVRETGFPAARVIYY